MRLVAGFLQRAGGGPCIFFAQVGQQDLFAHAHAAGNGLANGTTANQNDDLMFDGGHVVLLLGCVGLARRQVNCG